MQLMILRALAQFLQVNRVRVEAQVCEIPNYRAAAFDRPPRSILLRTRNVSADWFQPHRAGDAMISNIALP
jgi:hypothetical protein